MTDDISLLEGSTGAVFAFPGPLGMIVTVTHDHGPDQPPLDTETRWAIWGQASEFFDQLQEAATTRALATIEDTARVNVSSTYHQIGPASESPSSHLLTLIEVTQTVGPVLLTAAEVLSSLQVLRDVVGWSRDWLVRQAMPRTEVRREFTATSIKYLCAADVIQRHRCSSQVRATIDVVQAPMAAYGFQAWEVGATYLVKVHCKDISYVYTVDCGALVSAHHVIINDTIHWLQTPTFDLQEPDQ